MSNIHDYIDYIYGDLDHINFEIEQAKLAGDTKAIKELSAGRQHLKDVLEHVIGYVDSSDVLEDEDTY